MEIKASEFTELYRSRSLQELTDLLEGLKADGFVQVVEDESVDPDTSPPEGEFFTGSSPEETAPVEGSDA